jgi:hypothetical protein
LVHDIINFLPVVLKEASNISDRDSIWHWSSSLLFDSSVPNQFSDSLNLGNLFFSLVPDLLSLHLDLHFSSSSHHFFETFYAFFQLFFRDVRASVSIALLEETIGEILDLIGSGWHSWWTHWNLTTLPRAITCAGIVC